MENKRVRAKVHMLPTEDIENYPLYIHDKGYLIEGKYRVGEPSGTQKHLYFTTDEKIKEGDYVVQTNFEKSHSSIIKIENEIQKKFANYKNGSFIKGKIVATTDKSLGLPEPSQAFIQKYCELGGIEEVDLEYDEIEIYSNKGTSNIPSRFSYYQGVTTKIKTDSHNIITIHSIKDSWSREEVIDVVFKYNNLKFGTGKDSACERVMDWLNKNL